MAGVGGGSGPDATKQARALQRVGQGVNVAVDRFVTVGEAIADDNPEIKVDMYEACKEARAAGKKLGLCFVLFILLCFFYS